MVRRCRCCVCAAPRSSSGPMSCFRGVSVMSVMFWKSLGQVLMVSSRSCFSAMFGGLPVMF